MKRLFYGVAFGRDSDGCIFLELGSCYCETKEFAVGWLLEIAQKSKPEVDGWKVNMAEIPDAYIKNEAK